MEEKVTDRTEIGLELNYNGYQESVMPCSFPPPPSASFLVKKQSGRRYTPKCKWDNRATACGQHLQRLYMTLECRSQPHDPAPPNARSAITYSASRAGPTVQHSL
jgi:hypothetical protein